MTTSTASAELVLLDTNVIVYATDETSEHHVHSKASVDQAIEETAGLCITPQTLAEFYAIVTSSRRVSKPRSATEAAGAIESILAMPGITLLPIPTDVVQRWLALARERNTTGQRVFDLQLVATMLGNGV